MVATLQMLNVLSRKPHAISHPSGEKVKLPILSDLKLEMTSTGGVAARSQNLTGPSRPPLARYFPSGEKARDQTAPIWPSNFLRFCPSVATSQSWMVSSALPVASVRPSDENRSEERR